MSGLRARFLWVAIAASVWMLGVAVGPAGAVEDYFTVDLDVAGQVAAGQGTGHERGSWYYYPNTDWWTQWFFNGPYNPKGKKVVSVGLDLAILDPTSSVGSYVEVSLNWTKPEWPDDADVPPLPRDIRSLAHENQLIQRRTLVARTDVRDSTFINVNSEISDYCPGWISIDIRGRNVSVEGFVIHECVLGEDPEPPTGDRDFGDAPEGALAYPDTGVEGMFPTCVGVGPASWIEHNSRSLYFGPKVDIEADGNGGQCPKFTPNTYNKDEGFQDGDAGLRKPRAYTIAKVGGEEVVTPLVFTGIESITNACQLAIWDAEIDIEVHNERTDGRNAYVNVLFDWNHDGVWQGVSQCAEGAVPEHVLVNFPVPAGFHGYLSELGPANFRVGPLGGYVWSRFTISETPVAEGWNGDGVFADGETEDYLLHVEEPLVFCDWEDGDAYKMHWPQTPDLQSTGLDVAASASALADDFQCTQDGPITDIHFWGSFLDDVRPSLGVDSLRFTVSIYSNLPADNLIAWSRPGELLWRKEVAPYTYDVRQTGSNIGQGWFDPASKLYEADNHNYVYQYNICLDDAEDLFIQRRGVIYWLEIKEVPPQSSKYTFGWSATQQELQFQDRAVWRHASLGWLPISYPDTHRYEGRALDLAFVITGGTDECAGDTDFGDAPDPAYPTLLLSDGARHTVVSDIYLGRLVDGEFDGLPDAGATGDDFRCSDDEDGVIFSDLVVGKSATVEVTASTSGSLNAWIDWNADGDWDDAGEQVFADEPLATGSNTLPLDVPARAVAGETFARLRFSTMRGLRVTGLAPNGEVEDYLVRIEDAAVPSEPPVEHLKWSQPPLEWDPASDAPVYCGWDELSYASRPVDSAQGSWKIVADDFRCFGQMPVTSVHWWGSYQNWDGVETPRIQPQSWRIGFWSNVPADSRYAFSRPGTLLWLVNVDADRVTQEPVGTDAFPNKPSDTCFEYHVDLEAREYFWQGNYVEDQTQDSIFWVSITAVYTGSPEPDYVWGWKSRAMPWMDAAVTFSFRTNDLRQGMTVEPAIVQPITNSLVCERLDTYDMAFELDTDPDFIKWEQPFTGLRHWKHYEDEESLAVRGPVASDKWVQEPDTTGTGMDVDITRDLPVTWAAQIGADDFECTTTGPITGITLWGAWYHGVLPAGGAGDVTFTLTIREDVPAGASSTGYSMPGRVLWTKQFSAGQFTVESLDARAQSFYSPCNQAYEPASHVTVYRYDFPIDARDAFVQTGTSSRPVVYWLSAQAYVLQRAGSVATRFGWKASADHWNDLAVWVQAQETYSGTWQQLRYPKGHSLSTRPVDLAFAIETQEADAGLAYRRLVADDWQCNSATSVTGIVWWGSYIGYGYQPCECSQMTAPRQPDYFQLAIWSDAPDPTPSNPATFSYPAEKIWEYTAKNFDEVMVGFDKHPESGEAGRYGFEPVYRYTLQLPRDAWFEQKNPREIYWLSIAAVYDDARTMEYPWGWTNHPYTAWSPSGAQRLAHWKLDESKGAVAADSSGNGNDGTLVGNPIWRPADGQIGGAIDLDGRGAYIRVTKAKGLDFAPGSFSVSAWVNAREVRGGWQTIMEYDRDSTRGNRFGLWIDANGRFHFRVGMNTWQTTQSLSANQWHLLTATYDASTRQMKLYINGVLGGTATNLSGYVAPTQATLTIGVRGDEASEFFNGLLDDIRIYGTVLNADDVLAMIGAGRNGSAVAGQVSSTAATEVWEWTPLHDQTGAREDLSFMLFTDLGQAAATVDDDKDGEIVIPGDWPTEDEKK
jgi:hypothetical protein